MARGVAGAQAGASKQPTGTTPQAAGPEAGRGEAVGPLERGLDVLRVMADSAEAVRPGDLVRATGLARSAVDRIAATLVHLGYLRAEGRDLVLAPRLMEFGNAYLDASGLSRALRPSLERLTRTLDESVSAIVLDGCDARIVGTAVPPGRVIPLGFRVGDLLPSERCAAGAVLATGWDRRRTRPGEHGARPTPWTPVFRPSPRAPRLPAPSGRKPTSRPGRRRRPRTAGRWTTNWSPRGWSRWRSPSATPTAAPCARSACSRTPAATAPTTSVPTP